MTKLTKQEQKLVKIFKDIVEYEVTSYENGYNDGDIELEEFLYFLEAKNTIQFIDYELEIATRQGWIESPQNSNIQAEPKHINFLGSKRIAELKMIAAEKAIASFDRPAKEIKEVEAIVEPFIEDVVVTEENDLVAYRVINSDFKLIAEFPTEEQAEALVSLTKSTSHNDLKIKKVIYKSLEEQKTFYAVVGWNGDWLERLQ